MRKERLEPAVQRQSARVFAPWVRPDDTVIDFGCGNGGILASLPAGRKIGVEVSEAARALALAAGIEVYESIPAIPAGVIADIVITHHALEHVAEPMKVLRELRTRLRPAGVLIVVVPGEPLPAHRTMRWRPNMDGHLYSWNPMTLGNLVIEAGYEIERALLRPAGFTRFLSWASELPGLMDVLAGVYAVVRGRYNTVVVAFRPDSD
jgi:SAM-dependent methyltransferase